MELYVFLHASWEKLEISESELGVHVQPIHLERGVICRVWSALMEGRSISI